jgi:hypothetical protein
MRVSEDDGNCTYGICWWAPHRDRGGASCHVELGFSHFAILEKESKLNLQCSTDETSYEMASVLAEALFLGDFGYTLRDSLQYST